MKKIIYTAPESDLHILKQVPIFCASPFSQNGFQSTGYDYYEDEYDELY